MVGALQLTGRQEVSGVQYEEYSTPSVSPPILGEKKYVRTVVSTFIFGLIRMFPRFRLGPSESAFDANVPLQDRHKR